VFSVMLHAHRDWRIAQVQRRWNLTHEDAAERVRRTDELRRKYLQHFFSADLYDARAYDIVIDTERIGIDAAIEIARSALHAAMHPVA
jgi:cytidylate kinase